MKPPVHQHPESVAFRPHKAAVVETPQTMILTKMESISGIESEMTPEKADVLCGRGNRCYYHEGNAEFRLVVAANLPTFLAAKTRKDRARVVDIILEDVSRRGGRFLKRNKLGQWYDTGLKGARDKIGHTLRDAALDQSRHADGVGSIGSSGSGSGSCSRSSQQDKRISVGGDGDSSMQRSGRNTSQRKMRGLATAAKISARGRSIQRPTNTTMSETASMTVPERISMVPPTLFLQQQEEQHNLHPVFGQPSPQQTQTNQEDQQQQSKKLTRGAAASYLHQEHHFHPQQFPEHAPLFQPTSQNPRFRESSSSSLSSSSVHSEESSSVLSGFRGDASLSLVEPPLIRGSQEQDDNNPEEDPFERLLDLITYPGDDWVDEDIDHSGVEESMPNPSVASMPSNDLHPNPFIGGPSLANIPMDETHPEGQRKYSRRPSGSMNPNTANMIAALKSCATKNEDDASNRSLSFSCGSTAYNIDENDDGDLFGAFQVLPLPMSNVRVVSTDFGNAKASSSSSSSSNGASRASAPVATMDVGAGTGSPPAQTLKSLLEP